MKKKRRITLVVVAAFLSALVVWTVWGNTALELNRYTVSSDRLPEGFDGYPIYFDRTEKDNSKWLELLKEALKTAKTFEIHCWNEEEEWIETALRYGKLKESDWTYGKMIAGEVTPEFADMLLTMPKPQDVEIENKMTPFFNVFFDNRFYSNHYGTEVVICEK